MTSASWTKRGTITLKLFDVPELQPELTAETYRR
jgi:hypothetical protein